jgi:Transposase IS116/IS110/IS902 family
MGAKHPPSKDESWIWAGETMNLGAILETRSGCFSAMADSSGAPGPSPGRIGHAMLAVLAYALWVLLRPSGSPCRSRRRESSNPVVSRLMTIPGVDAIAGMAIVAAVGDFHRFQMPAPMRKLRDIGQRHTSR